MYLEREEGRIVIRPAFVEDLETPEFQGDRRPLYASFYAVGGREVKRRVYVPKKQLDPRLYLVKQGDGFTQTKELDDAIWCDADGYAL